MIHPLSEVAVTKYNMNSHSRQNICKNNASNPRSTLRAWFYTYICSKTNSVPSNQVIGTLGLFDWLIDVSSLIDLLDWPGGLDWLLIAN
jgi:hypothetical protein